MVEERGAFQWDGEGTEDILAAVPDLVDTEEYSKAFGEPLSHTLDLDKWMPGTDLADTYARLENEVLEAVKQDQRIRDEIRKTIFPLLWNGPTAFKGSGVYRVETKELERIHRGLLFNGAVEACYGISIPHDTIPLTIVQIGVCLVSYRGDQGSWVQRLYRRDLRVSTGNIVDDMIAVLDQRRLRGSTDAPDRRDQLSTLARRGIMTYAERAALAYKSQAPWRMGHGNPVSYELLTGAGVVQRASNGQASYYPLLRASLDVLRRLLLEHKRFVFVPSALSDRVLLTIGHALYPLEFAVVETLEERILGIVKGRRGHYPASEAKLVEDFAHEVGPQVVVGIYRASSLGPPYMFYAHRDYACQAAQIAMADSVLQEHRSFPTLLDLADTVCRTVFGVDSFLPAVRLAYVDAREPWRYESERGTRR